MGIINIDELIEDCLPTIRRYVKSGGAYSITIGGSRGKKLDDGESDVDFRIYTDERTEGEDWDRCVAEMKRRMEHWSGRGQIIDGVWPRGVSEIGESLDRWLSGIIAPDPLDWAVWGYHLPTDIYNQQIIEDPFGIAEEWKERMRPYPEALKNAILKKHMGRLSYWKSDYHYRQKVKRRDVVFLASVSASVVHDMMQALCAANGIYYPGDGHNLSVAAGFSIKPDNFAERIESIFFVESADKLSCQHAAIIEMIDEIEKLPGIQK
jgi:hypothetical protein